LPPPAEDSFPVPGPRPRRAPRAGTEIPGGRPTTDERSAGSLPPEGKEPPRRLGPRYVGGSGSGGRTANPAITYLLHKSGRNLGLNAGEATQVARWPPSRTAWRTTPLSSACARRPARTYFGSALLAEVHANPDYSLPPPRTTRPSSQRIARLLVTSLHASQARKTVCAGRDWLADAVMARVYGRPPVGRISWHNCGPTATCWNALLVPWCSDEVRERTDPAGPSSLAAYQTCRAGTSFGRAARSRPDTGPRPGLCTLARSAGGTPADSGKARYSPDGSRHCCYGWPAHSCYGWRSGGSTHDC
jgi:hypothetical protein